MQKKSAGLTYTLINLGAMPSQIIRQGKEIWDAHEYVDIIREQIQKCKEYEEKMFEQLPRFQGSRIISVVDEHMPRSSMVDMSWPVLITVDGSKQPTHVMNIEYKTHDSEPSLAGTMPVINVFFSHSFGITDFSELPFLNSETDLENGHACFRRRVIYEPIWHRIDEQDNWGVRANGCLIWCEDSINSIDRAGWGFCLPMAAVQTEKDFDTCILEPLKVLMQGINPDETSIPFSPYTLKYECTAA